MRKTTVILIWYVCLGMLSGCQWSREHFDWPWKKKSVPVTRPQWVTPEHWPATKPADEPVTVQDDQSTQLDQPQPHTDSEQSEPVVITGSPQSVTAGVLRVKGNFITVEDLVYSGDQRLEELSAKVSAKQFRVYAGGILSQELARKINDELILNEANARMSDQHKEHIDSEVEQVRRKLLASAGGSIKKLQNDLADRGTTLDQELQTQKRAITVQLYLRMKFLPAVTVNRQMLIDYYNSHLDEFTQPKKVQMQIIAAPFEQFLPQGVAGLATQTEKLSARKAAREIIGQAKQRTDGGEDFTTVAKELSKGIKVSGGGIWPMMPQGSFREKEVEAAAFVMNQGQVSDIIETDSGFYIVKVFALQGGTVESFEQAQEKITTILRQQQYDKLVEDFRKRLDESARRYYDPGFVELAVERACEIYLKK